MLFTDTKEFFAKSANASPKLIKDVNFLKMVEIEKEKMNKNEKDLFQKSASPERASRAGQIVSREQKTKSLKTNILSEPSQSYPLLPLSIKIDELLKQVTHCIAHSSS